MPYTPTNQRLIAEYARFHQKGADDLLRGAYSFEERFGEETFGVSVQINIPKAQQAIIQEYQKDLLALEPDAFIMPPPESLHLTIDPIILWKGSYPKSNQAMWADIAEECTQAFQKLEDQFHAFDIHFSELIAYSNCVFLGAYDEHDEFAQLREAIRRELPIPKDTELRNSVIHCVIARYTKPLQNPQKLIEYTKAQHPSTTMRIEEVILRKELCYPALKTEPLSTLHLR